MNSQPVAHLEVRELPLDGGVRREARLRIDGRSEHVSWHYDIFGGETEGVTVLDGYIHSALFHVMKVGLPLRVHGDLTDRCMYNMDELISAWSQWCPKIYKYIEIQPDRVVSAQRAPTGRAISAFSGGVDANFALVRNKERFGKGGFDIQSVLMVQGFDVDYDNDDEFRQLVARVQPTLAEWGVDLKIIKTNSKHLDQAWEDSFAAQISGCLHQFSGAYDSALIGSSEPYTALVIPMGSSPLTDRLFSTGFMDLVHDGAQFSRTAKVEFLANYPAIVERLKVCWEGSVQHDNCGACEKCIRTRLNFMAVGQSHPSCFSDPFDPSYIGRLRARNAFQLAEIRTLVAYAKKKGITEPWVNMLSHRLKLLVFRRNLRLRCIALLERTNLKETARHTLNILDTLTGRRSHPPAARRPTVGANAADAPSNGLAGGNSTLGVAWPVTPPYAVTEAPPPSREREHAN